MRLPKKIFLIVSLILLGFSLNAFANPEGENVVAGSAAFDRSTANTLTVNTASQNTIINYNSFSIAANETTRINQPNPSSTVLNRVVGIDPSSIQGTLSSNGKLFLVNPNGIVFGPGSSVNAPAIVASTLDITNDDFLNGRYNFFKNGENAFIINQGRLAASPGGFIALLSQAVNNQGVIIADLGSIALGAGEKLTLALDSLDQISVVIDDAVKTEVLGQDGAKIESAIKNSGTLQANGGKVILTAKVLNDVFDYAVNNSGLIQACSVQEHDGVVELTATGAPVYNIGKIEAGSVKVNVFDSGFINKGEIIADGSLGLPNGGRVAIEAATILQQGKISANALENGTAGQVSIVSTSSTVLDEGSSTEARALGIVGEGGRVLVNSTGGNTVVNKNAIIDVSAGAIAGNAGFIEISAYKQLGFFGILSGRAPPGYKIGTALLDPSSATIGGSSYALNTTIFSTGDINITGNVTLVGAITFGVYAAHNSETDNDWSGTVGQIINDAAWTITGTTATLNLKAGNGIGSSLNPIKTNVANLSTEINPASLSGDTYITQGAHSLNLTSISTPGIFNLVSGGAISQSGVITANTFSLTNTAANTILNTQANMITHLGIVNAAGRTFSLRNDQALDQTGVLTANTLNLTNTAGATDLSSQNNVITNLGTINAAGQTFSLKNNRALGETGVLTANTLNLTNTAGATTLNQANVITNLGTIDSTGGNFSLTNSIDLNVTGSISASGRSVTLNTGSNVLTFTAGATNITTGALTLTAADIDGIDQIGTLSSSSLTLKPNTTAATIGLAVLDAATFTLTTADIAKLQTSTTGTITIGQTGQTGDLTLGTDVDLSGKTVILDSGTINDTLNTISANSLTLNINSAVANSVKTNVTSLAANTTTGANEDLTVLETDGIALGAINVGSGTFDLTAPGTITQTGVLTAGKLNLTNTAGTTTLNQANAISNLGTITTTGGNFTLNNKAGGGTALATTAATTIDGTGYNISIDTGTAAMTFNATTIKSNNLTVTASDVVTLNNADLSNVAGIVTLKPNTAGEAINLNNGDIPGSFNLDGLEIANLKSPGTFSIVIGATAGTGAVTLGGDVDLGGKTVTINSGTINDTLHTIIANSLTLTLNSAAANSVKTNVTSLAANTTAGAVTDLTVNEADGISLGAINVDGGTFDLTVGGAITQTGVLTAGTLNLNNTVSTTTLNQANKISSLGTINSTGGALSIVNSIPLTIGGDITATGQSVNINTGVNAMTFNSGATNITTGALTLTAADIDGIDQIGTLSSSSLTLKPNTTAATIGLAVLDAATFTLTTADIAKLQTSTTGTITIGQTGQTGDLTLGTDVDLEDQTVIINSGKIDESSNAIIADDLTLNIKSTALGAGANQVTTEVDSLSANTASSAAGNRDLTINQEGEIALGNIALTNGAFNLNIAGVGAVTQSGALTTTGVVTIAAGAGNNVTLDNAGNSFNAIAIASGKDVTLYSTSGLTFAASTISGSLNATTGGTITQSGQLTVTGISSFTTNVNNKAITLSNPLNAFTGAVSFTTQSAGSPGTGNVTIDNGTTNLIFDTSDIHGSLTATTGGTIIQIGPLTVSGTSSFTTSAGDKTITLTDPLNSLTGAVSFNTLGTAGDVTIDNGTTNLKLGTSTVNGSLTATTGGTITQINPLTVSGTSSFITNVDDQAITLSNASNALAGAVSFTTQSSAFPGAGNVTINNGTTDLIFDTSTIRANLTATTGGAISQFGPLTVSGTSSFTASAGDNITLTNSSNSLVGAVTFNTFGAAGDVNIDNGTTGLIFGTSTISGNLNATTGGTISQIGHLIVSGTSSFTTDVDDQAINLNSTTNALSGAVSFTTQSTGTPGTGNVTIDNGTTDLIFDTSDIHGSLTATTGGTISQINPLTVSGTSSFTTDVTNKTIILDNPLNSLTGAVSFTTSGTTGDVIIDNGTTNLIFDTSNIHGNLSATTGGTITQINPLTVSGTSSFITNVDDQAITLDNPSNALTGAVSFFTQSAATPGAGNVTIDNGTTNLKLDASTISGNLNATTAGTITQSGQLTVTGISSFTTNVNNKAITLSNPLNAFTGAVSFTTQSAGSPGTGNVTIDNGTTNLIFDTSDIHGSLTATTGGTIIQIGPLTVSGTSSFTTSAGDKTITLTDPLNSLTGAVSFNTLGTAGDVTIDNGTTNLKLGTSTVNGSLTATTGGTITQINPLTVSGTSSFITNVDDQAITLSNASNALAGAVSFTTQSSAFPGAGNVTINNGTTDLIFDTSTIQGNLTATTGGAISQIGPITVSGTSHFTTNVDDKAITLNDISNSLIGAVTFTTQSSATPGASDVTIDNGTTDLIFAASTIHGNLNATTGGTISQIGALTVTGTSSFTTNVADKTIILSTTTNALTGAVTFSTLGTTGNVTLDNGTTALNLGASTINGNLSVTAGNTISQINPLTVSGTSSFTTDVTNKTIILDNPLNSLTGAVSFSTLGTTGDVIIDNGTTDLIFDTSNIHGNLSATTGGTITQINPLTVSGTSSFITNVDDQAITLDNPSNALAGAVSFFTQSAATPGAGNVTIDNGTTNLKLDASTISGNLDATTGGTITQSGQLTVTGISSFTTTGNNKAINLSLANALAGAVSFTTQSAGSPGTGNVTIDNGTTNLIFDTSDIHGTLTATTGGTISQIGPLTVSGASSFTTNVIDKTITLTDLSNALTGAVSFNTLGTAGDVNINNGTTNLKLGTSTVNGTLDLTTAGGVTQSGIITATTLTANLTTTGALSLGTQTNAISNLLAITAPGGFTLTNGNNSLIINGAVNTTDNAISITTGSGSLTTTGLGTISSGTGAITLTADTINLGADITGTGTITLRPNDPTSSIGIGDGAAGSFNLDSTEIGYLRNGFSHIYIGRTNGSGAIDIQAITFNDAVTIRAPVLPGSITVNGTITGSAADASITLDGSGATTTLNADIITAGAPITISDSVLIGNTAGVTLNTANGVAAGNNISITGTTDSTSGNIYSLTLNSGTGGDITLTGNVGATDQLNALNIIQANNVTFSGTVRATGIAQTDSQGTTWFNGDITTIGLNGSYGIDLRSKANIQLGDGGNIAVNAGANPIRMRSDTFTFHVSGITASSVAFAPYTAGTAIGVEDNTIPLNFTDAFLDLISCPVTIGDAASGPITIANGAAAGNVNLTQDKDLTFISGSTIDVIGVTGSPAITTTNNGAVTFTNAGTLTIAADGDMNLDGAFTQNGTGAVSTAGDITTTNDNISFAAPVTLTGDIALSTGAGAGDITFSNTLDGAHTLDLTSGTGDINFNDTVGGTTPLTSLTINSAGNVSFQGVNLSGALTQTAGSGTTTFNGLVSTGADVDIITSGGITFSGAGSINAGTHNVSLTSQNGSITTSSSASDDITANNFSFSAQGSVGSSTNHLTTDINEIVSGVSTTGDIFIDNAGDLLIGTISADAGGVNLVLNNGSFSAVGGVTNITAFADTFLSAPLGVITVIGNPLNVSINNGAFLTLNIGGKVGLVSGRLIGTIPSYNNILFLNASFPSPLYPPGLVYFNGVIVWPSANAFANSQANNTLLGRYTIPVNFRAFLINTIDTRLALFYQPLTELDQSAFDAAMGVGDDAYQFIDGSLNLIGHEGLLPIFDDIKKKKKH